MRRFFPAQGRDFGFSLVLHLLLAFGGYLMIRQSRPLTATSDPTGGSSGAKLAWVSVGTPELRNTKAPPLPKPKNPTDQTSEISPASGESLPSESQGGAPAAGIGDSSGGDGVASSDATQLYFAQIRARAESQLSYPLSLKRRGISGRTVISIVLLEDGNPERIQIQQSSGRAELDELALQAVRAAAPFPPIPTIVEKKQGKLDLSLPVIFKAD